MSTVQPLQPAKPARRSQWARRWGILQANWSYQSRQFFETSTLHGVRYISEKRTPLHERLLWFVCTAGGMMAALVIIDSLWDKFQTSPTITGLDSDYHNWDVPFPALTMCQKDPANESLIAEYVNQKWPDAEDDKKEYYSQFLAALANVSYEGLPSLLPFVQDAELPQTGLREMAFAVFSQCHVFTQCAYKQSLEDDAKDCCSFLHPIFTENGFCYSFNLNHTMKDMPGYTPPAHFHESFIEETDSRWSFSFDTEDTVNNSVSVYITSSRDLPGADIAPQHVWNKRVSKLMFVPKMTYTVDGARQLSMRQRGCVFFDEIHLRVSPDYYTFSACVRQCRMDKVVKACGCLPFFYTLLPNQRYCKLRELKCVIDILDTVSNAKLKCPCMLGCEHTVYDMEKPHEAGGESSDEGQGSTGVEVGFLSWPLTRYKRDVLFGQVDLLVAIGTIAGLFLGFSLLSGVEIVYLFTLRAWCMMHTDRQHLEELAEEYSRQEKQPVDLTLRPAFLGKSQPQSAGAVAVVAPASPSKMAAQGMPPMWRRSQAKRGAKEVVEYPYLH
ncbi:sodium channel protein Nach-like [Thrips palmi]|uniref:Sodium channel protein Nach-like n=1 Tax=Thrips palmi TaxID=161013 RepID=A0A6P8YXG4_THRPL|nr:sodium channel protein Nach-like [Thrips palmi]